MTTLSCPLVGGHFRPPAKQVLSVLHSGCPLALVPEPENPYDPKAIKVMLDPADILVSQHEALAAALDGVCDLDSVMLDGRLHVGYVADSTGKVCQKRGEPGNGQLAEVVNGWNGDGMEWEDVAASLTFAPDGQAMVTVSLP